LHKIHQLFLAKFLLLFLGGVFLICVTAYYSIKKVVISENKNNLIQTIKLIEPSLHATPNFADLVKNIHTRTALRITIVDANGVVLAESNRDKIGMENHKDRKEIMLASKNIYGSSVRFSHTLKIDFLYVAKVVTLEHQKIYFRLATPLQHILSLFYELWMTLALLFIIILGILYFIVRQLNKRVLYDIKQLKEYVNEIESKKYDAVIHIKYIYEFLEISLILKNVIKRLQKKDKKK